LRVRPCPRGSYTFLGVLSSSAPNVREYAARIGATRTAVMPTTMLFVSGTELDRHNPWGTEIGALVDPQAVHAHSIRLRACNRYSYASAKEAHDRQLKIAEALMRVQSAFITALQFGCNLGNVSTLETRHFELVLGRLSRAAGTRERRSPVGCAAADLVHAS
jgi:hypothetical protein